MPRYLAVSRLHCLDGYHSGGNEPRKAQEEAVHERRHGTNAPFSKAEVALIRKAALTPGAEVECPRCGSPLSFERPEATAPAETVAWWIYCLTCQRNLIVRGPPEWPETGKNSVTP